MHDVDYKIHGDDMQFVEIELDPQEAVVAEAGGMMFMRCCEKTDSCQINKPQSRTQRQYSRRA